MSEIKRCKCGNPVEVQYIAGIASSLRAYVKNPFAGSMPAYYIQCNKCGESACVRLTQMTVSHRDKCKKRLIAAWNRRAEEGESK
jgi:hypothetical protein